MKKKSLFAKTTKIIYILSITLIAMVAITFAATWTDQFWGTGTEAPNPGSTLRVGHITDLYEAIKPITDLIGLDAGGNVVILTHTTITNGGLGVEGDMQATGNINAGGDVCADNGAACLGKGIDVAVGSASVSQTGTHTFTLSVPGVRYQDGIVAAPISNWGNCCGYSAWASADNEVKIKIVNCLGSNDCSVTAATWKIHVI